MIVIVIDHINRGCGFIVNQGKFFFFVIEVRSMERKNVGNRVRVID